MPPIRCRTEKLMSSVLGENWKDHNKLKSTDESYMEIPNVQEQEMKSSPSQQGSTHQMSAAGSAVVHVENETEIPEGHVLESQLFQLIEEHQPKSGTMLTHDNKDSDEDPFSGTDSVADPMYVPETSTSHYSDSDEPGVNDDPGHPEAHCSENNKTHHSQNKETHHVIHPDTEKASDPLNSDEHEQEKILTRKRKCTPTSWKRNKQKVLRLQGKEHLSQKGNVVRGKSVQQVQCHCHYKCGEIFSLSDRQKINDDYLSLPDERSRWSFISSCITKHEPKRRYLQIKTGTNEHSNDNTIVSRKKFTFAYSLTKSGKEHRVCKFFFLATLDISGKKVEIAIRKSDSSGVVEADKRGKNPAPNRISDERKDVVRNHIKSIPVTDSHYCRSSTKRKYLPSGLSEMRLYQDYVEFCKEHEMEPVNSSYYIHIFTNEFNYGFHRPKKDMCDYCTQFSNKSVNEQLEAKAEHELHLTRKQEARDHKKEDKKHAKNDPTFHVYTMDMEKILLTPHLEVGQLYYKRKLKTFNFTVYNLADKQAINYMWHEANGSKGASEVSTCLWNLLKNLDPAVIEVTFFSDTAAGQNRNSILAAMFLRAVRDLPIQTINQKFMESGHSDMECDSVHSTIEGRAKHTSIFVPEGWYTVARTAKIDPPKYKVNEMHYKEFLDFKTYSQKQITNKNKAEDGEVMRWLDVKWLQFRKNDNTAIFYKTQLSQLEFKKLTIRRTIRKVNAAADNNIVLPLYKNQLPIEKKKLEDLQQLCMNGTIPSAYHDFYMKTLKSSVNDGASDESEVEDLENC